MRCKTVKKESSSYIDGRLEPVMARQVEAHLTECTQCAQYAEELALVSRRLGQLPRPRVPRRLVSDLLEAFDNLDRSRWHVLFDYFRRLNGIVLVYPRAVSSVASLILTASLFIAVLSTFKPIPEPAYVYYPKPITLTSLQFSLLNGETAVKQGQGMYAFPRVQESSGLDALLDETGRNRLVFNLLVHSDGGTSVVDVLDPPGVTNVLGQAKESIQGLRFQPARSSGRAVTTQLVVFVEKLDVEE